MRVRPCGSVLATLVLLAGVTAAFGVDVPLPGTVLVVRNGRGLKVVARPSAEIGIPTPGSSTDPTLAPSSIMVTSAGGGLLVESLQPAGWRGLGSPAGVRGYRYRGDGTPTRPFRLVVLKRRLVKMIAADDGTLGARIAGDVDVELRLGTAPEVDTYCARFGGTEVVNGPRSVKRTGAPAPAACAHADPCCLFARYHAFTADEGLQGDCGDLVDSSGARSGDIWCSSLHLGGGDSALPRPLPLPDVRFVSKLVSASCVDNLGPTTAAETGSEQTCTTAGCRFGAPIGYSANPPEFSICIALDVAGPAAGSLDCGTGHQVIDIPLSATVFLTGDAATDPLGTIPGTQPCPICREGTCVGGPNAGLACSSGNYHQTTADCPPDPTHTVGAIPVVFGLSSGTTTWTAKASGGQPLNFVGYCQDVDGTGAFENPPNKCLENGMAVGAGCGATFESCRQRTPGAFWPGGRSTMTISIIGDPQENILSGPSIGALVSLFALPPTSEQLVDVFVDVPGPAAAALLGSGALCADAMSCP